MKVMSGAAPNAGATIAEEADVVAASELAFTTKATIAEGLLRPRRPL